MVKKFAWGAALLLLSACAVPGPAVVSGGGAPVDPDALVLPSGAFAAEFTPEHRSDVETALTNTAQSAVGPDPSALEPAEWAQDIAAAVGALPDILSANVGPDHSVAVLMKDGTPFVFVPARPTPDLPEAAPVDAVVPSAPPVDQPPTAVFPAAARAAGGTTYLLADKPKAVLVNVGGLGITNSAMLAGYLGAKGYAVQTSTGTSSSLRSLVQGANFLWIASHSVEIGFKVEGTIHSLMGFQVGDDGESSAVDARNAEDEKQYRLVKGAVGADLKTKAWFMTRAFVVKYFRFAPESVAILDICSTGAGDGGAPGIRSGFHKAGAHTLFGWSKTVSAIGAVPVIKRLVDRMLGTNQYAPRTPKNRPYSAEEVYQYMSSASLLSESYGSAQLTMESLDGNRVILVPSLKHVEVDEFKETLTIGGEFGTQQKKLTLGGAPLTIRSWGSREVVASLPRTGSSSYGPLIADADGRQSNTLPITRWQGSITTKLTQSSLGSPGPWTKVTASKVVLRADIHKFRDVPDGDLFAGAYGMNKAYFPQASRDFAGSLQVGGEGINDTGDAKSVFVPLTHSLVWSPNVPEDVGLSTAKDYYLLFVGNLNLETHALIFMPADAGPFSLQFWAKQDSDWVLASTMKFANVFNANGIDQNWSQKVPHPDDGHWGFPDTTQTIPDLNAPAHTGPADQRSLQYQFSVQEAPDTDTES